MVRLRSWIKSFLPLSIIDRRHRIGDIRGYLGIRRKYGDNSFVSDIIASVRAFIYPSITILFFPDRPSPYQIAYKLCALLGYAMTTDPNHQFDVAFKWMDTTFFSPEILQRIPSSRSKTINAGSIDISKHAVNAAFAEVFDFDLEVDPTKYEGQIVEKSDENYAHDGRIIQGPVSPEEIRTGRVYQKAIDNTSDQDGLVLDYRVPIHGEQIPIVYFKYRPIESRFSNKNTFVNLKEPAAVFSAAELEKLVILAKKMGVNFGEFDVLRDKDEKIYVVDVNNTPAGPPNGLSGPESKRALKLMMESFGRLLEERIC